MSLDLFDKETDSIANLIANDAPSPIIADQDGEWEYEIDPTVLDGYEAIVAELSYDLGGSLVTVDLMDDPTTANIDESDVYYDLAPDAFIEVRSEGISNNSYYQIIEAPIGAEIEVVRQKYDTIPDGIGYSSAPGDIDTTSVTVTNDSGKGVATISFDPTVYQTQTLTLKDPNNGGYLDSNPSSSAVSIITEVPAVIVDSVEQLVDGSVDVTVTGRVIDGFTLDFSVRQNDGNEFDILPYEQRPQDDNGDGYGEWSVDSLDPNAIETLRIRLENSNNEVIDLNEDPDSHLLDVDISHVLYVDII